MSPNRHSRAPLIALALFCAGCGGPGRARIVRLADSKELTQYTLRAVRGRRDGDRLLATIVFSAGASQLSMDLRFLIGVPTHLESGRYRWDQREGAVAERSVTFLGGQSGPPSIGGTFELLAAEGAPLFRVHVPVTQVK